MDHQKKRYQPKRAQGHKLGLNGRGCLIAIIFVVLLLLGGYTGLCALVNTEQALPGTEINGRELSGMTLQQSASDLQADFQQRYGQAKLTVSANGEEYTVEMGDILTLDAQALAQQALDDSQSSFFLRGAHLLRALAVGSNQTVLPSLRGMKALRQALDDSGLMEINTTVQTRHKVKDGQLVFTIGVTGNSVDEEGLLRLLSDAVDAGDYETVIQCPMLTGEVKAVDVDAVYDEIYQAPVSATLDPKKDYAIVDSITGVSFDKDEVQKALDTAEEGSTLAIDLTYKEPEITTQEMKDNLFKDVLGSYKTNVSGTANRLSNVSLAASKINGTILLNGDEFSYNGTVGERTAANGFKTAGAYLNGETVQELGGGICQVSSTLYAATLYSNLKIEERHNHTFASSYIGLGLDATVSWGGPDFRFSNDKKYPIKIAASYSNGTLTVQILGTKTNGNYVEMKSETLETIGFKTETRQDSSKYEDESYTAQSGHDGYKVQTYRLVYDKNGKLLSKEKEAYSDYSTQTRIVYVGTKVRPVVTEPETAGDTAAQGATTGGSTNNTTSGGTGN